MCFVRFYRYSVVVCCLRSDLPAFAAIIPAFSPLFSYFFFICHFTALAHKQTLAGTHMYIVHIHMCARVCVRIPVIAISAIDRILVNSCIVLLSTFRQGLWEQGWAEKIVRRKHRQRRRRRVWMDGVVHGEQALWLCNDFQTIHTLKTNSQLLLFAQLVTVLCLHFN